MVDTLPFPPHFHVFMVTVAKFAQQITVVVLYKTGNLWLKKKRIGCISDLLLFTTLKKKIIGSKIRDHLLRIFISADLTAY